MRCRSRAQSRRARRSRTSERKTWLGYVGDCIGLGPSPGKRTDRRGDNPVTKVVVEHHAAGCTFRNTPADIDHSPILLVRCLMGWHLSELGLNSCNADIETGRIRPSGPVQTTVKLSRMHRVVGCPVEFVLWSTCHLVQCCSPGDCRHHGDAARSHTPPRNEARRQPVDGTVIVQWDERQAQKGLPPLPWPMYLCPGSALLHDSSRM